MRYFTAALIAACALATVPALAQQAPSPPSPAPSPTASPSPRPWQASGYAAASYSFVGSANAFTFLGGAPARVFDTQANAPMLNAVNVQLQKNGTLGGKLELLAGQNADVVQSYPWNNNPMQHFPGFDVVQAYVSYAGGPFTLQAGKFETLAGAEVIEDPSDANVTRSILFGYAVPFTHTGLRLTWSPSAMFSVIGGVNNGWDNLKGPGGGQSRTAEFGVAYNGPVFALTAQTYQGTERVSDALWSTPFDSPVGHRSLVDAVATYKVTSAVSLVANYDTGSQANAPLVDATGALVNPSGTATWNGLAGYVNWTINPTWSVSGRYEGFRDHGGYRTGYDQYWTEGTVTIGYAVNPAVTLRAEGRWDRSSQPVFSTNDGLGTPGLQSVGLQALLKF